MDARHDRIARLLIYAAEIREQALTFEDVEAKQIMFELADRYEALAAREREALEKP